LTTNVCGGLPPGVVTFGFCESGPLVGVAGVDAEVLTAASADELVLLELLELDEPQPASAAAIATLATSSATRAC
jgi:hypothetical protein